MDDVTPVDRARAAAKALLADGDPVTTRAIRDRARVRMAVAAQVAREVVSAASGEAEPIDVPDQVSDQVAALWRLAIDAAKQEHEAELQAVIVQRDAACAERDELVALVTELEAQLDQARKDAATASDANIRALAAEARADGLREALAALSVVAPVAEKKG